MSYQNRLPPEGINVSSKPWAGDLLARLLLVLIFVALAGWLLLQALTYAVRWIPISYEQRLTGQWWQNTEASEREVYLQDLTEALARAGGMATDIKLFVHLQENDTLNAFATLGGNIVVFDGLLETLESEQALAFVLAHEAAHIALRHPIEGLTRQVGAQILLALVFGQSDLATIAGAGGNLALLTYTRDYERAADVWAYRALANHYGHINGSAALFHTLADAHPSEIPAWLGTHPDIEERLRLRQQWAEAENWPLDGALTPLSRFQKPIQKADEDS